MANSKHTINKKFTPNESLSQEDFICLITEAENGSFKPVGTFEEFKKDIMTVWQKRHSK